MEKGLKYSYEMMFAKREKGNPPEQKKKSKDI